MHAQQVDTDTLAEQWPGWYVWRSTSDRGIPAGWCATHETPLTSEQEWAGMYRTLVEDDPEATARRVHLGRLPQAGGKEDSPPYGPLDPAAVQLALASRRRARDAAALRSAGENPEGCSRQTLRPTGRRKPVRQPEPYPEAQEEP